MQQAELGTSIPVAGDLEGLKRGDLVFWKGDVGIMIDDALMVHANAHHMMVAIEPAEDAFARIKAAGNDITSVKRIA
jgi:cell wall-associated NlpC family hydrolase